MTENQEKELFITLTNLVSGVNEIKADARDIKGTLGEHSQTLSEQSQTLSLLVSKVDSVAATVMTNDKRLTAVEKDVDDLRDQVH